MENADLKYLTSQKQRYQLIKAVNAQKLTRPSKHTKSQVSVNLVPTSDDAVNLRPKHERHLSKTQSTLEFNKGIPPLIKDQSPTKVSAISRQKAIAKARETSSTEMFKRPISSRQIFADLNSKKTKGKPTSRLAILSSLERSKTSL